ncbi:unnamed protein product [Lymnaea stagnalis]|uniref:AAA+ ATPase domain-containing protein n=1 Tax=Lymnaea stagnalis TaxID=6523 RepID=A0AAV2HNB2_LYMST
MKAHRTTTKLKECSKDSFDVSESNIVEFMASTQVDPSTVTPKVKRYLFFPKKKVDNPTPVGLFDKFSAEFKKVNECSAEFKKGDEHSCSDIPRSMGSKTVTSKSKSRKEEALSPNINEEAKLASIPSGEHFVPNMSQQDRESPNTPHQGRESPNMPHQGRESPNMLHQGRESPNTPHQGRESPDMPYQDRESPEEKLSSSLSDIEDYFVATQVDKPDMVGKRSEQKIISNDTKIKTPSIKIPSFESVGDKKDRSAGEEKRKKSDVSSSKSSLTGKTSKLLTAVPSNHSVKEVIEKNKADVFPGDYRLRKNYISHSLDHKDGTNVRHPLKYNETSANPVYKGLFRSKSADQVPEVPDKPLSKLTPSIPHTKSISNIARKNELEGKDSSTSVEAQNESGVKNGFKRKKRSFSSVGEYASLGSAEKDKSTKKSLKSGGNMVQPESPTKTLKATQSLKDNVPKKAAFTGKLPSLKRSFIDMEQNKSPVKRQKNVKFSWLTSGDRRMKQKDPKKKSIGTAASISLNIEAARQRMLERQMKVSTALHKSNAHQSEKTVHHNDEEDVEMPCTQDIMARGLPILTARLPVDKTKLNLGLPSQGRVAPEEKQNNSNLSASDGHGKSETGRNEKLMRQPSAALAKSPASLLGAVKESSPSATGLSHAESSVRTSNVTVPNSSDRPESSTVEVNASSACVSSTQNSLSAVPSSVSCSSLAPRQKSSVGMRVSVKPTEDQTLPRSILKQPDKLPERKTVNFRDSQNTFKFIEPVSRPFREMLNNVPQLTEVPQSSPEFITSVLLKILGWNTNWLREYDKVSKGQSKAQQPPPLLGMDNHYSRLRMYFETFKEYLAITSNLLILETWELIYQDWKKKFENIKKSKVVLDRLPYYPTGRDGKKEQVPLVIEVIGVTSRCDRTDQLFQDDFLILKGYGKPKGFEAIEPNWREQFALVQGVKPLWDKDIRWLNKSYPHLQIESSMRDDILIYQLTLKIKYQVNYFPSKPMEIQKISNLKTLLRQLEALTLLPDNPLCGQLLCPSEQNVFYHDTVDPGKERSKLNTEQAKAVASIKRGVLMSPKAKKVFFLQGPAGTGKTQTIMALIHQILLSSGFKARICLATPSNAAVDEVAKRIIQFSERLRVAENKSISLVRIGNRDCIKPVVKPFYWETLVEEQCKVHTKVPDSLLAELEHFRRLVSNLKSKLADPSVPRVQKASKDADLLQCKDKIKSLESELRNKKPTARERYKAKCSVMDNAHVICGTLSSFGMETVKGILLRGENHRHKDQPFTCLIIDEATQAIEVDCLIPLQYKMTKVVLVGDQKQLPATVLSQKANELELGRSLFERLNLRFEEMQKGSSFQSPIMMLVRQYRMNPEVLALPNNLFYDGKLKTDDSVLSRKSFLAPYLVFDIQGGKESSNERSLSNVPEAECTASLCSVVMEVLKESPSTVHKRVGVICPYADQKQTILNHLRKRNLERIEVNTVDGFQGQERDVIIMSCVRAQNNPTTIGFLADKRRMNVSLTRAKLAMYVMGHFETLKTNGLWSELYQDACNRKLLVDIKDASRFSSVAGQRLDLNKHSVLLDR